MNIESIFKELKDKKDLELLKKAFTFANAKLSNQYYNGASLIEHILQVLSILVKFKASTQTLISCLLYKTINYGVSIYDIELLFGSEIASATHLASLMCPDSLHNDDINQKFIFSFDTNSEEDESLISLSKDSKEVGEAFSIKLAIIFYILKERSIDTSNEFYLELANLTTKVTIPLARELKLCFIASQLDDLCFSYTNPVEYYAISSKLPFSPDDAQEVLENLKQDITTLLTQKGFSSFEIKIRVKSIRGLYEKMQLGKQLEKIYDFLGLRIILSDDKPEQCYKIIDTIHSKYSPIDGRIKDYIAKPKENEYQSLHTTIIDESGITYEIQVRTNQMNKVAEDGRASHSSYKCLRYSTVYCCND